MNFSAIQLTPRSTKTFCGKARRTSQSQATRTRFQLQPSGALRPRSINKPHRKHHYLLYYSVFRGSLQWGFQRISSAFGDHFFRRPPRGDARHADEFLQSFHRLLPFTLGTFVNQKGQNPTHSFAPQAAPTCYRCRTDPAPKIRSMAFAASGSPFNQYCGSVLIRCFLSAM